MTRISTAFLLLFTVCAAVAAEEGMWPPPQLPKVAKDLKALGLEIDPRGLTDLAAYPLNAVVRLGGCSASFVSPDGLIITNYHCAYSSIQLNSSTAKNLLKQGFLARSRGEELPGSPGLHVFVTVGLQDVTSRVLDGLQEFAGEDRVEKIDARRRALMRDCEKEPGFHCQVASFYGGVRYSLVRQLELRDVRLVYAPPEGVGRYGGEVDNFAWPQQRGDFAFFRAYAGPGGKPADPAAENRPYHPGSHLKIAAKPLKEGDFVMVAGYPNSTNRYRLSSEVEDSFLWQYPRLIESYQKMLRVVEDSVDGRPEAALKYAGFNAGVNNSLKYIEGLVMGYTGSRMLARKLSIEKDLAAWVVSDSRRKATYGDVVGELRAAFARQRETRERERRYHLAAQSTLLKTAREVYRLAREREKPAAEQASGYREQDREKILQSLEKSARNFDPQVDRAIWRAFLLDYQELPADQRVEPLDRWFDLQPGRDSRESLDRALDGMYARTGLGDFKRVRDLASATAAEIADASEPFLELATRLDAYDRGQEAREKGEADVLRSLYARYMSALVAYMESRGETLYPDANGTLRVSFGQVKGYTASAGVRFPPFSKAEDVVAKNTGAEPFDTPAPVLAVLKEGRFGSYRDPRLATLPINFLGTVDVTGGNSGAPTLNGRGELVGLLFDINQEGIISSWDYNPAMTRSIHLDIRYVLWLLDEVEHARDLLVEMGVASTRDPAGPKMAVKVVP